MMNFMSGAVLEKLLTNEEGMLLYFERMKQLFITQIEKHT